MAYGLSKRYKLNLLLQFFRTIVTAALYVIYKGSVTFPGVLTGQARKTPRACVFVCMHSPYSTTFISFYTVEVIQLYA